MSLASGLHQSGGDAHTLAFAPDAALHEVVDTQRLTDLTCPPRRPLEDHRRPSCQDPEATARHGSQLRDDLFRQAIAEVLLRRIVAQVQEWEHSKSAA